MQLYAYNNPNNEIGELLFETVPIGTLAGKKFDNIFSAPKIERNENGTRKVIGPDGEEQLLNTAQSSDVVVTSTLTNFSIDFIVALQVVENFKKNNVRVIALLEDFDSARIPEMILISMLPMMKKFRKNAIRAKIGRRKEGIKRASAEGKYKGRQALTPNDFPNFTELYNKYMYREIGKSEFAKELDVSRPTLDKLLKEFTTKKG